MTSRFRITASCTRLSGAASAEDAHEDGAQARADQCGEDGLPDRQLEVPDRDDAQEDRGELEVRRHPCGEKSDGLAVAFFQWDKFRAARLNRADLGSVIAFADYRVDRVN